MAALIIQTFKFARRNLAADSDFRAKRGEIMSKPFF
jgi:hypothetical protein